MSDELIVVEESVTEVLLDLMTERVISERGVSIGVQASSMRGLARLSIHYSSRTIPTIRREAN
jgi:hypothetical protein